VKPHEVAQRLRTSGSTIRAWSNEFGRFLSPSASGGTGRYRDFNDQDMQILYYVKSLRNASVPLEEVHLRLEQMQAAGWTDLPLVSTAPPSVAQLPVVSEDMVLAERRNLLQQLAHSQARISELEQRLSHEQGEKEKLLREIADLKELMGEMRVELKLYREGRIKPPE
jgi:DNA-binding transcriptional MerR regulator